MRKAFTTLLLILSAICVHAQRGGESVYPFLDICPSANYAGIGGYVPSARISGPNSAIINPALSDTLCHNSMALNMVSYVADIRYTSALYSHRAKGLVVTGGALLLDYGDFPLADGNGNISGTFSCSDAMILASASREVVPNLRAGASAKIILSSMETYKSQGMALDMGLLYQLPEHLMTFGLTIRNLGKQISTYNGIREHLPLDIRLGVSKQLRHAPIRLSMAAHSLNHPKLADDFLTSLADHLIIGAEIFPDGVVGIRGGFNFLAHNDLHVTDGSPFPGFSFGIDVRLKRFSVQYGRQCISPAGGANLFTAEVFINRFIYK